MSVSKKTGSNHIKKKSNASDLPFIDQHPLVHTHTTQIAALITQMALLEAKLDPIGTIEAFYDFGGLLTFNTTYFAYCDGSVLVDANSPFNGQTLPDLSNRYMVGFFGPNVVETISNPGGPQGSGYTVGNVLTIATGGNNATVLVNNVNGVGGITNYSLIQGGTGYTVTGTFNLTGGTGTGAQVQIDSLDDAKSIGIAAFSATPVGISEHVVNLLHSHTIADHFHILGTDTNDTLSNGNPANIYSGGTGYGILHTNITNFNTVFGDGLSGLTYTTSVASTTMQGLWTTGSSTTSRTSMSSPLSATGNNLSAVQSIQPESVRVRFIIRKN